MTWNILWVALAEVYVCSDFGLLGGRGWLKPAEEFRVWVS